MKSVIGIARVLLLAGLLATTGCASLHSKSDCECEPKHGKDTPKTLFDWKVGSSNGDEPEEEPEADAEDEIVTDRPDFTEASSTVGAGRIQLEAGYTYSRDRDGGLDHNHSYPEALFRIGMFANWFELRIGQNFSNTRQLGADGGVFSTSGGDDLYLGTKLGLTEQKEIWPEMALIVQTTVPTGPRDQTAGRMLPGLNWLYGWDTPIEWFSVGASSQANSNVDGNDHTYVELAQSVTANYALTKKLGAFTEFFAFFPEGATSPDAGPQYYFDGGFTYKITPNFQYDIRGGVGLNRRSEDFFVGSGFAVRY